MKIGYIPESLDFSHPADRRHFYGYVTHNKIPFEIGVPSDNYDIVYLSKNSDI